ncbi:cytochrome P450 [Nonomuraea sp. NPDC000554]|uniref:cytochrome P450 n=1 Tax=Nonomuraea sp. NPDC000554 TaxID=3154259 RepID=UPI003319F9C7
MAGEEAAVPMFKRSAVQIPGPRGGIFADHLEAYEANPATFLEECRQRYGDVFRFDTDVVVVTEPAVINTVLVHTNRDNVPNANPLHGGRFPTPEQTRQWMRTRQVALPVLKPASLPSRLPSVSRTVAADLRALEGAWFDPAERAWRICVSALLPLYFPEPPPELTDALLTAFVEGRRAGQAGIRIPSWWPSRLRRRVQAADQRIRDQIAPLLTRDPPGADGLPGTLLEHILDRPEPVPADVAQAALGITVLGAIGTMGGAWCWLLYHLAAHPEAFERIRAEVAAAAPHELGAHPERALPYTQAFVHEVLRVHPPAWLLGRDAITSVTLGDLEVPAGTAIMFSPYLLHHDARWWDEPERFDPGRWLRAGPQHAPGAYLPFAAGPRGCLGTHLGMAILLLTAAHLTTDFHLETSDLDQVSADFGPTLIPTAMSCRLTARSGTAERP